MSNSFDLEFDQWMEKYGWSIKMVFGDNPGMEDAVDECVEIIRKINPSMTKERFVFAAVRERVERVMAVAEVEKFLSQES